MIEVFTTQDPVGEAARLVAEVLVEVDRTEIYPRLAASGGSALNVLAGVRARVTGSTWGRLRLTWADERCVPAEHPDSNAGTAMRRGIFAAAPPIGLHLPMFDGAFVPDVAAARFAATFRLEFGSALDAIILGMGEDGHVASLFPGHPALDARGGVVVITDSPKPPPQRLSLTLDVLAGAQRVVLFATGAGKKPMLERILAGDRRLPAASIPNLVIVTDQSLGG